MPRMVALIALFALLILSPAFGAESPGGEAPQVVDIEPPSQAPGPTPEADKSGIDAATEAGFERRLNEFRREILDDYRDVLDARARNVDRWLTTVAVVAPILALIGGLLGFQRLRNIEEAARRNAEEAKNLVEEIKEYRVKAEAYKEEMEKVTAQAVSQKPDETARTAASIQENPEASSLDRAIAAAVQLQGQEKIEEAIEQWRSIATVAGEEDRQLQARAWFSVGYLRSVGGVIDREAVIDAYTRAIELNPTASAYYNRGNAKDELGRHEAAIADYNRAIELNPTASAYYNRGNAKNSLRQYDAAIADYSRAIELNPTDASAYCNRGNAKNSLRQYDAAIADYSRAIELNPTDASAYYNRGNAKNSLRQYDEAIADYNRAIELSPTHPGAYYNRGNAKREIGRINEAREDYQKALVLAQEAGGEALITAVKQNLSRLDDNK